jgi:hypothetical protein
MPHLKRCATGSGHAGSRLGFGADFDFDATGVIYSGRFTKNLLGDGIDTLAHFGPPVLQNEMVFRLDFNFNLAFFEHAIADTAIF